MFKPIAHYTWDEKVYETLLSMQRNGEYMEISMEKTGKVIEVTKEEYHDGRPYIRVVFEVNE